ncbi:zinc finger protein 492-like [Belonocnema kinseyi]|uniref:zinc finger protein 492-like n=1 Tax=Belonocnema kinseyi TaxID=2817044 RepID=UPI00143D4DB5|nr:zinc finger protein 492-like [Belonocnema kinseyi]
MTRPKRNPQFRTKSLTSEISFPNEFRSKTLIKYDNDETLDIKEEIIQDQETEEVTCPNFNTKYAVKECIVNINVDMLASNVKQLSQKKEYIQNLKPEVKYKCKKCARSYKEKKYLTYHQTYECDVTPQFKCNFCGKLFKRKSHVNAHARVVHLKSNSETSKAKYNCDNCTRSYNSSRALTRHKREKHAAVPPEFICDYCGRKMNQKSSLATHIHCCHFK